jgi:hypothetical protein
MEGCVVPSLNNTHHCRIGIEHLVETQRHELLCSKVSKGSQRSEL